MKGNPKWTPIRLHHSNSTATTCACSPTSRGGEPLFVGKDVAKVLGYSDANKAVAMHVDKEDRQNRQNDSFDSQRGMTIINESGL